MQFETFSLSNQDKCLRSRVWTARWLEITSSMSAGGAKKKAPEEPSAAPARLLVVLDGDYSPLWLDHPSLSGVFAAAVCGLIESERHGGSEETHWLAVFLWSTTDWHGWLFGRRQMFPIAPLRPNFDTLTWRERKRHRIMIFVSGGDWDFYTLKMLVLERVSSRSVRSGLRLTC